jgi:1,2-phenylacetyl-CoA epoxidase PaaB subunit
MVITMLALLQEELNFLWNHAGSISTYTHRFSMYAIRDFMIQVNDRTNYTSRERGSNKWIVHKKDDMGELYEAFRNIRRYETPGAWV